MMSENPICRDLVGWRWRHLPDPTCSGATLRWRRSTFFSKSNSSIVRTSRSTHIRARRETTAAESGWARAGGGAAVLAASLLVVIRGGAEVASGSG